MTVSTPTRSTWGVGHSKQAIEFYERVFDCDGDFYPTVNVWPAVDGGGVHVPSALSLSGSETWPSTRSMPARSAMGPSRSATSRTSAPVRSMSTTSWRSPRRCASSCARMPTCGLFGSSLGKSLAVEDADEGDIAPSPARGAYLLHRCEQESRPAAHLRQGPGGRGQIGRGRGRCRRQEALARHGHP